jgi:hypothetical protein
MHGMDACWFCREPVTEPREVQEAAVARAAVAVAPAPVAPAVQQVVPARRASMPPPPPSPAAAAPQRQPVEEAHPAPGIVVVRHRPTKRLRPARVIVLGAILGVVLTVGALAWEATWIRAVPASPSGVELIPASFESVDVAVSYPSGWAVAETSRRVTFLSDDADGERSYRGFRVTRMDVPFKKVQKQIDDLDDRLTGYRALSTDRTEVDDERAVAHAFVADDLRFEQWWIDRGERLVRVDLWSRQADDDAPALNERLVRTIALR